MQFITLVSVLALAAGISAQPQGSFTSVDTGSCREYTYCMSPSQTTGLFNIFGEDQDVCDSVGGDQYCCSQQFTVGGIASENELNNICGLSLTRK